MYYTEQELLDCITTTTDKLNSLPDEFRRGVNDCYVLFLEYNKALRKTEDVYSPVTEEYNSTKEWFKKLTQSGHTVRSYAELLGFETVVNKRPKVGDVAFWQGSVLIAGEKFWITTDEKSSVGIERVVNNKQVMFLERHMQIFRPRK